jgi:hypothetical protein
MCYESVLEEFRADEYKSRRMAARNAQKTGGDDETRTRDLCRDRSQTSSSYNNLKEFRRTAKFS